MKKAPSIMSVRSILARGQGGVTILINGEYMPARPFGYYSIRHRLKAAWLVFTGKADAVTWPGGQ